MPSIPSLESFRQYGFGSGENDRPVIVYVTTSHEDMEEKVLTWENTVFTYEKLLIALKFFDAFRVDLEDLEEDDPILEILEKPKPLTFYTFFGSRLLYKSKEKPSGSKAFSLCSRTFSKVYKDSFKTILKKEEKILDELDKVIKQADKLNDKLEDKLSEKDRKKYEKEFESLIARFEELEKQEKELFESPVLKESFAKKTD